MSPRIATITLNPAIDQTVSVPNFCAGEVNRVAWEQSDPGGKGVNVASFLTGFGHAVTASGFLGKDNAELFQQFFMRKGIADRFVLVPGHTRVNVKIIDELQNQITDLNFPGSSPAAEAIASLNHVIDELTSAHDWFILSGSIPSELSPGIYAELTQRLKAQGKTVILDASGDSFRQAIQAAPDAIKPNLSELEELLGQRLQSEADIVQAARNLLRQGIRSVVVSMGAKGAIFVEADQALCARPPQVKVVSTVGAGDAMVSGLVVGKLRELDLADCARLATAFSIAALSQVGPRLPSREVVESFMTQVEIEILN